MEETPVPIPNTEVKLLSADGTARGAEWESRSLPGFFYAIPFYFISIEVKSKSLESPADDSYEELKS